MTLTTDRIVDGLRHKVKASAANERAMSQRPAPNARGMGKSTNCEPAAL
jgi:hypothetical protein